MLLGIMESLKRKIIHEKSLQVLRGKMSLIKLTGIRSELPNKCRFFSLAKNQVFPFQSHDKYSENISYIY